MIDWENITYFTPSEFPEDPDKHASFGVILGLNAFRARYGKPVYPSKALGALARFDGSKTSQHYSINRKSTAVDFFCEGTAIEAFIMLLNSRVFTGIGIYLDTNGNDGMPWVMFHGDTRRAHAAIPKIWIVERIEGKDYYRYPQRISQYWKLLSDQRMYEYRQLIVDHK